MSSTRVCVILYAHARRTLLPGTRRVSLLGALRRAAGSTRYSELEIHVDLLLATHVYRCEHAFSSTLGAGKHSHSATHVVRGTGDVCLNRRPYPEDFRYQILFSFISIKRRGREVIVFYLTKKHTNTRYPAGATVSNSNCNLSFEF